MIGTLTAFDWVLILILVVSTIGAFSRGIISVVASLAGLAAGLILASWNYLQVAQRLGQWLPSYQLAQAAAFLLILVAVLLAFSFVARILRSTASAVGLGFIDRLLGAVFGLLRGCLLGTALMIAAVAFSPHAGTVENSRLAPYFLAGAHALSFVVPEPMQRQIADGAAHLLQRGSDFLPAPKHQQRTTRQ